MRGVPRGPPARDLRPHRRRLVARRAARRPQRAPAHQRQPGQGGAEPVAWARQGDAWVFHVDADEIVRVDRDGAGRGAGRDARWCGWRPLEAVSQAHWDGDPTWFKRLLTRPELASCTTLGVIDRPHNGVYFHGHVDGKSGIRPGPRPWLTLHHGVDADGTELERRRRPRAVGAALRVLLRRGLRAQVDLDPLRGRDAELPARPPAHRAGRADADGHAGSSPPSCSAGADGDLPSAPPRTT